MLLTLLTLPMTESGLLRTKFEHITVEPQTGSIVHKYYTDHSKQFLHSTIVKEIVVGSLPKGTVFHKNGNTKMEFGLDRNDQLHGRIIWYREDGTLWKTGIYIGGKRAGSEIIYYPDGKTIQMSMQYINDVQNGNYIANYPNGHQKERGTFKNGQPCDVFVANYDNAKNSTMISCTFGFGGILHGDFKLFAPDNPEMPIITYYYNNVGNQIGKVETQHEKLTQDCQNTHDRLIILNETNKLDATSMGSNQRFNNNYEENLQKAIQESFNQPKPKPQVDARAIINNYKQEQIDMYKKDAANHLAQLKACCADFYRVENKKG